MSRQASALVSQFASLRVEFDDAQAGVPAPHDLPIPQ